MLQCISKINVDVAVSGDGGGCSAVMRDEVGRFVGEYFKKVEHVVDPLLLELYGIREALMWLKDLHRSYTIVESDCFLAVTAVNGNAEFHSSIGLVIDNCRSLLSALYQVRAEFVKWSANHSADVLAKALGSISDLHVWGCHLVIVFLLC